ncbi:MAG TPA: MgtC/SapB family protein [Acidobacteriaceae bacterium]|nr:MgtC/SapB family protein [Acidobacteriaceae bacterium]
MPLHLTWPAIALRLALTLAAGGLLGWERTKTGHAAGLRTTLLVTLAASVAMIQANLLLPTTGKAADSFIVMDLMRFPLGILTGVGFIGAGAILHKGDLVLGVTTAATMWFATVVGLCLGGGQLVLGSVSAVIGFAILWLLRWIESLVLGRRTAELSITAADGALDPDTLLAHLPPPHFRVTSLSTAHNTEEHRREIHLQLEWRPARRSEEMPAVVRQLEAMPGILQVSWRGTASGMH